MSSKLPLPVASSMPRCPTCQSEYAEDVAFCPRDGASLLPAVLEGRYRVLSLLGAGGMGVVYLAEHLGLHKRVAVKLLRGELSRDATFARRFEQEAIAASQIGHENIVTVTDLGHTPSGELFYVMELLEGESLSAVLVREHFLPLWRAVPVLAQVCRALEAAHARGIVHRDVKPQNVMLLQRPGQADFVKVVDFGISKVLDRPQHTGLTESGAILGTADYMAPEQAQGGTVDARTDVYAMGVLTYQVCTGSLPLRGENTFATLLKHLESPVEPPSQRRPDLGLPPELDALVLAALAKEPAARPSLERLRVGLEALVAGQTPMRLTPAMAVGPASDAPELFAPTLASPVREELPPQRSRKGWVLAGLGALLLAGGAGLWALRSSPAPAVEQPAPAASVPVVAPPAPTPAPTLEPAREVAPSPPVEPVPAPVKKPTRSPPKKSDKVRDLKPNPF